MMEDRCLDKLTLDEIRETRRADALAARLTFADVWNRPQSGDFVKAAYAAPSAVARSLGRALAAGRRQRG